MSSSNKNRSDQGGKQNDRANKPKKKRPPGKTTSSNNSVGLSWPVVVASVCGMLAAWVSAGSTGLLVTPFRHAIVGLLLGVTIVALRPAWRRLIFIATAVVLGIVLSLLAGGLAVVDVLAVAAVLATLVFGSSGQERRALFIVAMAACALAVFRAASFAVPTVWSIDQMLGYILGWFGSLLSGRPLDVGASLGGFDLLLMMGVFYTAWLYATPAPRKMRAIYAGVAILAVQAIYLVILSHATQIAAALPETPLPETLDAGGYRPTNWNLWAGFRAWLPWNLPLLAAVAQAVVAAAMLRWTRIELLDVNVAMPTLRLGQGNQSSSDKDALAGGTGESPEASKAASKNQNAENKGPKPKQEVQPDDEDTSDRRQAKLLLAVAVVVALVTGWLTAWPSSGGDLSGKKVVAFNSNRFDRWIVPTHDSLVPNQSANRYGLLASLVTDLGGEWSETQELSEADLDKADVLVVIDAVEYWPEERIERLKKFVREGGALLVVAGPMIESEVLQNANHDPTSSEVPAVVQSLRPVNGLLKSVGMAFRNDLAISTSESWQGALAGSTHPAVFGVSMRTIGQGLRHSPTIDMNWPSRPILIGRWGWAEPGSDAMNHDLVAADAGQQWGNLVLAAERPLGKGTVVALGGYWSVTNVGIADGYEWTGRLLRYLAVRPSNPQNMWRQVLGLLGYLALFVLVVWRVGPVRLIVVALTLAVIFTAATCYAQAGRLTPDRQDVQAELSRPIAYVDTSHLELGSDLPWSNDGLEGFLLTLARNGYLPLKMHQWDAEQLKTADMLVVIGPAKPFTKKQLGQIHQFVEEGGCLICMIGATEAAVNRALLDEFEFRIDPSPSPTGSTTPEAEPMGQYPDLLGRGGVYYLNARDFGAGNHSARVWYCQAWPIKSTSKEKNWQPLVYGYGNVPLVIHRWIGKGDVVLIGDSRFALNFGHGYENGQVSGTAQDNADFWHWMISRVTTDHQWIPPDRSRPTQQGAWRQGRSEVWR